MKIEEYIKLRKTQDEMNEFDVKKKLSNMHLVVDYVFEFFSTYVDIDALKKREIEKDEKLIRYQKQIGDFSIETQNWMLKLYAEHNTRMNVNVKSFLRDDMVFPLYNEPAQFRKVTFNCFAKFAKKYPYLEDYTEELFQLITEHHKILNEDHVNKLSDEEQVHMPEEVQKFVMKTRRSQHIDLMAWAETYAIWLSDQEKLWPASHKISNGRYGTYNFKVKKNRFLLDQLFQKLGELGYLRGKKKFLEMLIMYKWAKVIDHEAETFYQVFLNELGYVGINVE